MRLFASSSVSALDTRGAPSLVLLSSTERLTLFAASVEERDGWVAALESAIAELAVSGEGACDEERRGGNNAPWMEALVAEDEARKARWRRCRRVARRISSMLFLTGSDYACRPTINRTPALVTRKAVTRNAEHP